MSEFDTLTKEYKPQEVKEQISGKKSKDNFYISTTSSFSGIFRPLFAKNYAKMIYEAELQKKLRESYSSKKANIFKLPGIDVEMVITKKLDLEDKTRYDIMKNPSLKLRIYQNLKHTGELLKSIIFYPRHTSEIESWIASDGNVKTRVTRYFG